jgi:hypothetical protein
MVFPSWSWGTRRDILSPAALAALLDQALGKGKINIEAKPELCI